MSEDIIKCNICNQVLISGEGSICLFGEGTSIQCKICGNKYTFGEKENKQELTKSLNIGT